MIQVRSFMMMFFALIVVLRDTCFRFSEETITFQNVPNFSKYGINFIKRRTKGREKKEKNKRKKKETK